VTVRRTLSLLVVEIYRVLLFVCRQNSAGWTVKSLTRIAKIAGCARSTVAKHLRLLQDHGFLSWVNTLVRVTRPAADALAEPARTRCRVFNGPNGYALENRQPTPPPSKSETRTPQRRQRANLLEKSWKTEEIRPCEQSLAHFRDLFEARRARAGPK
jgi:hypothetical protein